MRYEGKYQILEQVQGCYLLFCFSCEMKLCYEGLKEIGVDVNEI